LTPGFQRGDHAGASNVPEHGLKGGRLEQDVRWLGQQLQDDRQGRENTGKQPGLGRRWIAQKGVILWRRALAGMNGDLDHVGPSK
jgi:hypothetical protein